MLFLESVRRKALSGAQERPEPFFVLPPDGTLHVVHELARRKIQAFFAFLVHMVSVPEMFMAADHAKDPVEYLLPIPGTTITVAEHERAAEVIGVEEILPHHSFGGLVVLRGHTVYAKQTAALPMLLNTFCHLEAVQFHGLPVHPLHCNGIAFDPQNLRTFQICFRADEFLGIGLLLLPVNRPNLPQDSPDLCMAYGGIQCKVAVWYSDRP